MEHNFNEKATEYSTQDHKELPVFKTPKYLESKKKVVEMLESGIYKGLTDNHFWILMNRTKNGKMAYTGLIISHDGMQIINDSLPDDQKVKSVCFSVPIMSEYEKDCMYMYYQDETTMEFGEVSIKNCKHAYPYAMLYKRCFDRVVRAKAKMYGVYSESEAEEFSEKITDEINYHEEIKSLYNVGEIAKILQHYQIERIEDLDLDIAKSYYEGRKK